MLSRDGDGGSPEGLAPVTYLPGVAPAHEPVQWAIPLASPVDGHSVSEADDGSGDSASTGDSASLEDAEAALARRLRRSALSERESRSFLAQRGAEPAVIEATVGRFLHLGWIDDAVLADQLLHSGTTRKGQGRRAIAQTLSARGIPRDVADAALDALPDDDAERALEYARTKAHGLRSYDLATAMRRLTGQLARRGYGGAVASHAARTALTEEQGGVHFR